MSQTELSLDQKASPGLDEKGTRSRHRLSLNKGDRELTLDERRLLLLRPRHLPPSRRFFAREIRYERQPLPDILALDGIPPDLGPPDARRRVLFAAFADLEAQV